MFFATSGELTRSAHPNAFGLPRPIHERAATVHLHAPRPAKTLLHAGHTLRYTRGRNNQCFQLISNTVDDTVSVACEATLITDCVHVVTLMEHMIS